jgi:predicted DNA-binding transcriptional regulator AlpA
MHEDYPCPFARVNEVAARTGFSVREVWRRSRNRDVDFPRPRKLSARRTVWLRDDVMKWLQRQMEART